MELGESHSGLGSGTYQVFAGSREERGEVGGYNTLKRHLTPSVWLKTLGAGSVGCKRNHYSIFSVSGMLLRL